MGSNYLGQQNINDTIAALSVIRDSLKAHGTELIFIIAPGKAQVYPEYLPDHYLLRKKDSTNYMGFRQALADSEIPTIDFLPVLQQMKGTVEYAILPEAGLHWSIYASKIAGDSVIRKIEQLTGKDLPDVLSESITETDWPRYTDADVGEVLNLLVMNTNEKYAYSKVTELDDKGKYRPNVLGVGDSYYWGFVHNKMHENFYSPASRFYFYFKDIFLGRKNDVRSVDEIRDLRADLCSRDVILLVCSDGTLYKCPYGFISGCNRAFGIEDQNSRIP